MPTLKIAYVDHGEIYEPFIKDALSDRQIVKVSSPSAMPDLVVCSAFGSEHKAYDKFKKLYITGENDYPDFNKYDYCVTCHDIGYIERHLRVPFYAFRNQYRWLISLDVNDDDRVTGLNARRGDLLSRKFCSAVISNGACADPRRSTFFHAINNWKKVDSAGKLFNNVGPLDSMPLQPHNLHNLVHNVQKHFFIANYKFNLAFENSVSEGYVTEKITDAFAANTIPIYFGTRDVTLEFNSDAFINATSYENINDLIARIDEVNGNDDLYMAMLTAPKFRIPCTIDSSVRGSHMNFDYLEKFNDFIDYVVRSKKDFGRLYGWTSHKN